MVADSGGGKTSTAIALAMTVATGGMWGDKQIVQMPVYWVAGQGQEDLRAMYEGWLEKFPGGGEPQGRVFEDAVDFASEKDAKKFFREELEGKPPGLIVIDALGDMIGTLNEKETRDMNLFYRNIWWMARKNKGVVLVLHHTGWVNDRERGAKAIRDNSDIVVQITKFDPWVGVAVLQHNKRRGGAMLKGFTLEVELVDVEGCLEAVPVVTGPKGKVKDQAAKAASAEPAGKHEKDMRLMMTGLLEEGGRATNKQWQDRMRALTTQWKDGKVVHEGWAKATFSRKLAEFKAWCPNLRGGPEEGGQDHPYWLEPVQPPKDVFEAETGPTKSSLTPTGLTPYSRGVIPLETGLGSPKEVSKQSHETSETGSSQGSVQPSAPTETDEEIAERIRRQLG